MDRVSKHRASRREVRAPRRARTLVLSLGLVVVLAVGGAAGAVAGALPWGGSSDGSAQQRSASAAALRDAAPRSAVVVDEPVRAPAPAEAVEADVEVDPPVPADSGAGRRIVFSQTDQRVWLVGDDEVERTYPVSGSRFDNLSPGRYRVQSKTQQATAFDGSGTMEYFVRFATGYSEPIGFHSVPRDNAGVLEQTKAQLGTPLSAGCVRQWKPDAIALWDFAPVGTPVVVTP